MNNLKVSTVSSILGNLVYRRQSTDSLAPASAQTKRKIATASDSEEGLGNGFVLSLENVEVNVSEPNDVFIKADVVIAQGLVVVARFEASNNSISKDDTAVEDLSEGMKLCFDSNLDEENEISHTVNVSKMSAISPENSQEHGYEVKTILEMDLTHSDVDLMPVLVVDRIDYETHESFELTVGLNDKKLTIRATDENQAESWKKIIRLQIMMAASIKLEAEESSLGQSVIKLKDKGAETISGKATANRTNEYIPTDYLLPTKYVGITPPKMNIAILVVGTRGDVQPFIYFGQQLQKAGHRVRLATHAEYRPDVTKGGLEYYPLGGDPRKLSEYMVKTRGRLIPDLMNKEERQELPEKLKMLKEICYSTWPAVSEPDPEDPEKKPFVADAIISNPVSYGHIHCAQKLRVPLHIMFPQPWHPTMCFPHPLMNLKLKSSWSSKNYYSYIMFNDLMFLSLGPMQNEFRTEVLGLPFVYRHPSGHNPVYLSKVPISHMWSPSFVPKCPDWPDHIDVVGEFRLMQITATNAYKPSETLSTFLAAGPKPIYIGFGSMVIDNVEKLVNVIKKAAQKANCRVLLQSGWTKYAEDETMISDEVMVIGAMPHDFLFTQVAGVIHHGGAGTTSAGLRAGNPTFICPFFGDQHFWAEMVSRSGAGPKGCPINVLTSEKLAEAFIFMRLESTIAKAKELGDKMAAENGCEGGVNSFYRNLPLDKMICDVSIFHNQQSKLARVYCIDCGLKMCPEVDKFIHRDTSARKDHRRVLYEQSVWENKGAELMPAFKPAASFEWPNDSDVDHLDESDVLEGGVGEGIADTGKRWPYHKTKEILKQQGIIRKVQTGVNTVWNALNPTNLFVQKQTRRVSTYKYDPAHSQNHDELTADQKALENAFSRALHYAEFWDSVDGSYNRDQKMDEKVLTNFLLTEEQSKTMQVALSWNGTKALTFCQFAWLMNIPTSSSSTSASSTKA